jgi:UDP:flavonoid glycosyltransferase YjiC (YdhE family)
MTSHFAGSPNIAPGVVAAGNTVVVEEVPHRRVLSRVDLVVTDAGHGTVLSSLAAGVPLLCMPMGRDQHDVSARVAAVGAGVVLDIDAPEAVILAAARRVLDGAMFHDAARDIAQAIAREPGVGGALRVVDRVAGR